MPLNTADFCYVRDLVKKRSAIALDDGKSYLAESRLAVLARQEGFESLDSLLAQLRAPDNAKITQKVVEAMTTNETSFFRDVHPWDALRDSVLPDLIKRREARRRLTIWCGAASSGQEPYSLAMLLRERFATALTGWSVQIIATDLSTEILQKARSGRYSQLEVNRGLPATMLVKYFQRQGIEWELKEEVRKMIDFRILNLIEPWPNIPVCDLVTLRNVLIYFEPEVKKQILAKIRKLLTPDGYLFLGGSETTMNLDDNFARIEIQKSSCYRLREATAAAKT